MSDIKSFAEYIRSGVDSATIAKQSISRGEVFKEGLKLADGDVARAIDYLAYNDVHFRSEVNNSLQNAGYKRGLTYDLLASELSDSNYRAGGSFDTITTPGGANTLQTTVGLIVSRVEELGQVLREVESQEIVDGNLQIPVFSSNATAAYVGNANATNLGTTLEGVLNQVTLNPQRIAGYIDINDDFIVKISSKNVTTLMDKLAESYARGVDNGILQGAGTGSTPLGMLTNATVITAGANDLDTLRKAIASASINGLGGYNNLRIFMNTPTWTKYGMLSTSNMAYNTVINAGNDTIFGIPVIKTDVLGVTADASNVIVGYKNHYVIGISKQPSVLIDQYSGSLTGTQRCVISGTNQGRPLFNNSFARFSVGGLAA
jgi:HK97 family phage major capsid protein